MGLNDLNIFPAVPYDLTFKNQGIQITIVFKSKSSEENIYFLNFMKQLIIFLNSTNHLSII